MRPNAAQQSYNTPGTWLRASADAGPLHRAEWVKYLALFFNREAAANVFYSRVAASYQAQLKAVQQARPAGEHAPLPARPRSLSAGAALASP